MLLPDILDHGLDVIFVGAAPSPAAAASGHYYAGPRNRFWDLLFQSRLTPIRLDPCEDRLAPGYGIGLTAVFLDVVSAANALLPRPSPEQVATLNAKLARYQPLVVCYNGKDVCRMCTGEPSPPWGMLPDRLGGAVQFVVPSSSGRADRWGADRLWLFGELRDLVRSLKQVRRTEHEVAS